MAAVSDGRVHPVRVLVLWSDPDAPNFGLRALAAGTEELVKRAADECGVSVSVDFQNFTAGATGVSFGMRGILRDLARGGASIGRMLASFDLIVDTGAGDSYTSIYGWKRLLYILYARRSAWKSGTAMMMGPQTLGPFDGWAFRAAGRWGVKRVATIVSRDPASSTFCAEHLGRRVDLTGTDVVFALPRASAVGSRDVLVNVSGLLWCGGVRGVQDEYRTETAKLVHGLTSAGRRVTLLPHVIGSQIGQDDVAACEALRRDMRDGSEVDLVVPSTLAEMRGVISGARVLVGARMHACLNALSQGIPAVPWAYSRKFAPLLNAVGWEDVVELGGKSRAPAEATVAVLTDAREMERLSSAASVVQRSGSAKASSMVGAFARLMESVVL
jgi:polysaccharide pyruvyl transferase WcaK-like protein